MIKRILFRKRSTQVFIVGCVRSGTTYLQSFLSAHPDIFTFHEAHFFNQIKEGNFSREHIQILQEAAQEFFKEDPEYRKIFEKKFITIRGIVNKFIYSIDQMANSYGKKIWVEKTPSNLHNIEVITDFLPDAKFIHIIRNGKDVVASHYETSKEYPEIWGSARSIETCVNRWNKDVNLSLKYMNKKNHFILKYSDLINDMKNQIVNITNFIGIPFSDDMIIKRAESVKRIVKPDENWKNDVFIDNFSSKVNKFDFLFNEEEKSYIENNLLKLGDYFD